MTPPPPHPSKTTLLTINGGSSSIKFAAFNPPANSTAAPERILSGEIERIGSPPTTLSAFDHAHKPIDHRQIEASNHQDAARHLIEWLIHRLGPSPFAAIGHRVVHGGLHLLEHCLITTEVMKELTDAQSLDPTHLPREIALIQAFRADFPDPPQIACFDTAFHRDLPRIAQLLPIPRRFTDAGIRRFGFHGLSYAYLLQQLEKLAGPTAARRRLILAHLGSGASMAAVREGKPLDTSMAFTPAAGLVMSTRPGDLDPGLVVHLMRTQNLSPDRMDDLLNNHCGLLAIAETGYDMRDLLSRRNTDPRAAEAIDLFCYQARKFIGAYAAALGGLDTLVFAGGIGEHAPQVRAGICDGLQFLGLRLDPAANAAAAPIISAADSAICVRIIPTDEEQMIAREALRFIRSTL